MPKTAAIYAHLTLRSLFVPLVLTGCQGSSAVSSSGSGGHAGTSASDYAGASAAGSTTSAGAPSAAAGSVTVAAGGSATNSGCAPPVELDGFVDVPPSDPAIRFVGRVVVNADYVTLAFPAVQIQTAFEGDAIDLRLRDFGLFYPVSTNVYWVIVDGVATKLDVCSTSQVYPLARNLGPGTHTLTIIKRTESSLGGQGSAGRGDFFGLRVRPGTRLSAVAAPTRRMLFVGDSITCGYGNEVSTTDPDSYKFSAANEDAWHAYGAVAARALGADYVAVAASGRGVIRNYGGFFGPVVPKLFETPLPDDSGAPAWDHTRYAPDVVVVNLGTNDFSPGIALDQFETHRANFRQGYIDFLTRIREVHPAASIIAAVGPMLNDEFPEGYAAWTSVQADVSAVVDARRASGDSDVYYLAFTPQQPPYGEDWHPTLATHQQMADAIVPVIAQVRGW